MRRNPGIVALQHQLVHAANVGRVDVLLVGIRDGLRLLVGALAESHARLDQVGPLRRRRKCGTGSSEARSRRSRDRRDKAAARTGRASAGCIRWIPCRSARTSDTPAPAQDLLHDRHAEILRDIESHRRELDRNVGVEPSARGCGRASRRRRRPAARASASLCTLSPSRSSEAVIPRAFSRATAASAVSSVSPATNRLAKLFASLLLRTKRNICCWPERYSNALRSISFEVPVGWMLTTSNGGTTATAGEIEDPSHRKPPALLQPAVEKIPGCEPVIALRFEEVDDQCSARLRRGHDEGFRKHCLQASLPPSLESHLAVSLKGPLRGDDRVDHERLSAR